MRPGRTQGFVLISAKRLICINGIAPAHPTLEADQNILVRARGHVSLAFVSVSAIAVPITPHRKPAPFQAD